MMDRSQMAGMLGQVVQRLYNGAPVPPEEGGLLFRTLCDERRRAGDMVWTERRIHDLARELGYWPWTVRQIGLAFGELPDRAL